MLYDPKWEVQTKPDAFSLEGLTAWLEKQPANKGYNWSLAGSCLLGQWCEAIGLCGEGLFTKSIELGQWDDENKVFAEVALGDLNKCTFGAALSRARKLAR